VKISLLTNQVKRLTQEIALAKKTDPPPKERGDG
jgi:hypothetical protein